LDVSFNLASSTNRETRTETLSYHPGQKDGILGTLWWRDWEDTITWNPPNDFKLVADAILAGIQRASVDAKARGTWVAEVRSTVFI
jgi:hypothetical protein